MIGFGDEVWWSRIKHPSRHTWQADGTAVKDSAPVAPKNDPDPKACACYGLLLRPAAMPEQMLLRMVEGRPVNDLTLAFLTWASTHLATLGKRVLLLIWDNASWHVSAKVRAGIRAHNLAVKHAPPGVRILRCQLSSKSPWLNPIEPKRLHAKRAVAAFDSLLCVQQLTDRIYAHFNLPTLPPRPSPS